MEKYQNQYRIQSNRLPKWDYSGNGVYFITICVNNRVETHGRETHDRETHGRETHGRVSLLFGHVEQGKMILNDFGEIAHHEWELSAQIRKEIELDAFVIMPNHLHGIVIINKSNIDGSHDPDGLHVETHGRVSLQPQPNQPNQQLLHRKPKSISSFIAGYKSSVTTKINNFIDEYYPVETHGRVSLQQKFNRKNKLWQPNYYDHIIRDEAEYNRIRTYIIENPQKWEQDKFYQ